ncbi:unnamed protein product [Durusdinium trenchii]|uniref:Uncharacterized protein n=1 Tax=Durusdinium trenchii TaxID=1381693 RepID=A0ABP0KKL1_9DINO
MECLTKTQSVCNREGDPGEHGRSFASFDYPWRPGEMDLLRMANRADAWLVQHAERLQRLDWEWMEEKNPWAAVVSRRRRIGRLRRKDVFLSSGRDLTKVKNLFL